MELKEFFKVHSKVALGFSGGVDSSYLLYAAKESGADVFPIFVKSQFQPEFELEDAIRLTNTLGIKMNVVQFDALGDYKVLENNSERCYYCKQNIFGTLMETAKAAGYTQIMDGTNASDDAGDRPGMRALKEMKVLSPLRECGITKPEVRERSKAAGLFTWDKPAYACLATRIPTNQPITEELLTKVEQSEKILSNMGYRDFRVRVFNGAARLQLRAHEFEKAVAERAAIRESLKPYFDVVLIDLEERE